ERRRLVAEGPSELLEPGCGALRLHHDSGAVVADESSQSPCRGQPVDERPESNALYDAAHHEAAPLGGLRRRDRHAYPAGALGFATSSRAPAICSSAPLMPSTTGPIGRVCFSIARTPKVTSPRVADTFRRVAAIAIRYTASTATTIATSTSVTTISAL